MWICCQRSVAQLRELAVQAAKQRTDAEYARQEAARLQALQKLAQREAEVWQHVEDLGERKIASAYDQAVDLLCQLRDLAQHRGDNLDTRLAPLLERWKARSALMQRLKAKNFVR